MAVSSGSCPRNLPREQSVRGANLSATGKVPNLGQSPRNVSAQDVIKLIAAIVKNTERSLTVLYGHEYEEVIYGLPELLSDEFIVLTNFKNDGKTEILHQMLIPSERKNFLLVLDTPANIITIFQTMRTKMLKTHLATWILLMEGGDAHGSVAILQEFVNEGTQVIIFVKNSDGDLVYYLPSIDTYGITRFTKKGRWDSRQDLELLSSEPQETYDLSGRHLKVAVKEILLGLQLSKDRAPDGSVEMVSGLDMDIITILRSALKFSFKAYIPRDNVWGDLLPDGNITGIIGMVARREATLGLSVLSISESRERALDFAYPYSSGRYLLLSRSPKEKNRAVAILSPFTPQIWAFVTSTLLLMGPVVYSVSYLLNKVMGAEVKTDLQWFQFNIFRSIVNQGNSMKEDALQIRLVLLSWFFFCFIYAALYSGMLTASLAAPAYETPIDSLEDLPRAIKGGFTLGTLGNSNYESLFKTATGGLFKQTWELFNHNDRSKSFVDNIPAGVQRVLKEKFVFITSDNFARAFVQTLGEGMFHLSRERLFPSYFAIACQTGSPITNQITRLVLRLKEGGIIEKIIDDAYRKLPAVPSARETEVKNISITLTHLQTAFYMFTLGTAVSTLAFILERLTLDGNATA
ncbi:glutamate receptor ionotropic, delta-2-like isoform X2 [Macrobrachium nipponense]